MTSCVGRALSSRPHGGGNRNQPQVGVSCRERSRELRQLLAMHPFEVLAQPIRRRIVEILASGEHTAGTIEQIIAQEFGVTRSATQHHLAYLLRNGWVDVRADATERWYRLEDDAIPGLRKETRRLRRIWDARIGTIERRDPPLPRRFPRRQPQPSRLGYRGLGADPDDPWRRPLADPP
jgi:DNA-binding transcriptional ArsR family regulator